MLKNSLDLLRVEHHYRLFLVTHQVFGALFLSRGSSTLEKLAEMTKSSSEARTGSGAKNTKNFVFALLSPEKKKNSDASNTNQAATIEEPKSKSKGSTSRSNKVAPDSKKIKIDRSIDENSSDTI